jgi:hypothetical protein
MEWRNLSLGIDPRVARAFLEDIHATLSAGGVIDGQAREYLLDAIKKILKGVDANRALLLKARKGKGGQWKNQQRDLRIFYHVEQLCNSGKSKSHRKAFLKVAEEESKGRHALTEKGVERIYRAHKARIKDWKKWFSE